MILMTYISVLLHFSVAINDYNYVLDKYSVQPSANYILMSKLCRAFKLLSICDKYNQDRNNLHRITPTVLEYYPSTVKRRHTFVNERHKYENAGQCICKCCSCPQPSKLKYRTLYNHHRNYERNFQQRKNKFKEHNKYYYLMPLVRKKYKNLRKQRKKHYTKRFSFADIATSIKNTTKNTYGTAKNDLNIGYNFVKNGTVNTYDNVKDSAIHTYDLGYKYVKNGTVNAYDTVKDSAIHTYDLAHDKIEEEIGTPLKICIHFLNKVNTRLEKLYQTNTVAQWNYEANLTEINKNISIQSDIDFAKNLKEKSDRVKKIDKKYNCSSINATFERQIKFLTKLQESALSPEDYKELQNIVRSMEAIYSKAVIKDYHNSSPLQLEPDINNLMAHSRDPAELQYVWESWRHETGRKLKMFYPRYIELTNKAAHLNGFANGAEMWLSVYEQKDFEKKIYEVWEEVEPLYQQLHTYVRRKLKIYYGEAIVSNEYIPAHLLGNVFGQTWINIYNLTIPFPKYSFPDLTTQLQLRGYTPIKMFKEAESFFISLGLPPMTNEFWKNSILEPKHNVQMVCHASAWDMQNKKDFRIKMCTHVTYEDFTVIHHEMGHVEYYMLYKDLPIVYRDGANPGFHEAIGDTIGLSVSTPHHIQSLGLKSSNSPENEINFLFLMALQKIAFLPYALVVESWRWGVFKGDINLNNYNEKWWKLREKYQRIQPPSLRSEDSFDPGGKYHIAAGVPYIRYFVSFIIQFQFHEALCEKSGQLKDNHLHTCDIYNSAEAGNLLRETLSLGKSISWSQIMRKFTQNDDISAKSLLKYFDPLQKWLIEENKNNVY